MLLTNTYKGTFAKPEQHCYYQQQQKYIYFFSYRRLYYSLKDWYFGGKVTELLFLLFCVYSTKEICQVPLWVFKISHLGSMWLLGWSILALELKAFLIVSMNSHTAMVGHWPGHCGYPCDDTCRRIITENSVCGFSVFPSSTQDIYFTITHRHTTVFLFNQIDKKKN